MNEKQLIDESIDEVFLDLELIESLLLFVLFCSFVG